MYGVHALCPGHHCVQCLCKPCTSAVTWLQIDLSVDGTPVPLVTVTATTCMETGRTIRAALCTGWDGCSTQVRAQQPGCSGTVLCFVDPACTCTYAQQQQH
jgi:hypothetical protein